ncbi:hypothetical protein QE152_g12544 [Popillia japonica]|uniref:Transposase n=1 Tax=Popillia japonica TaxID=7064 RepID=A0AAW1LRE3_POPJA
MLGFDVAQSGYFWQSLILLAQKATFKDPETGAHTNSIESSWRAAKSSMTTSGRIKAHVPGNLARYMFLKRCRIMQLDRTLEFFRLAGELYNPVAPREDLDEDWSDVGEDEDFLE